MPGERGGEAVGDVLLSFRDWLQARDGANDIAVIGPGGNPAAGGITLALQRLEHGERRHTDAGNPLIEAILLLVIGDPDPMLAASIAGDLLFALHDERWVDKAGVAHQFRVEAGDAADAARLELGLPPMLALLLRVPIERSRRQLPLRPVLHPLRIEVEDLSVLEGSVVGQIEGGKPLPLAEARVEAVDYGRSGISDHRGRFRLAGVPASGPLALTIEARQQVHSVTTNARTGVVLTLPMPTPAETPKGQ